MIGGVGRSAAGGLYTVKQSWEGGSHIWLLPWEIHQWHQCPVLWIRFIFLNCLKHAVQSREQALLSIFLGTLAYQTSIEEAFLNYKKFTYAEKEIAWLWKCTFCLFSSKFVFSTELELDSTRLRKKEDKSRLGQKRHSPKEQRFQCCISEPLTELCWP